MNPEIGDSKEEDGKTLFWSGEEWLEIPDPWEEYPKTSVMFPGIFRFNPEDFK